MMNKIDNSGQGLAKLGRDEDQYMAHVAQGEMVVPPIISPETRARIEAEMRAVGLSPDEYTVGDGMSINPITGMPEFGWLKKTFKSVKKVVKKAAPVIGVASMFIPGVGAALSGALGSLGSTVVSGLGKIPGIGGALSSGASAIGSGIGSLFGGGAAGAAGAAGGASGAASGGGLFARLKGGLGSFFNPAKGATGIFGGSIGPSLRSGIGSLFGGGAGAAGGGTGGGGLFSKIRGFFNPAEGATGIFGGSIGPNLRRGIGSLFGGGMGQPDMSDYTPIPGMPGAYMDKNGNILTEQDIIASQTSGGGLLGNLFRGGGRDGVGNFGMIGDLAGGLTDRLGLTNYGGQQQGGGFMFGGGGGGGGLFGGNLATAGLAGLVGKAAYDAAKERSGGLAATPAVMMDELGRYQLSKELGTGGTRGQFGLGPAPEGLKFADGGEVFERQYFNMGGVAELDMRDGGESSGPGTGTSDDIPAMLSDGEYVMTAKATRGAGAFDVNQTKSGIELIKGGSPSREKGVENMRELMNIFEAI